MAIDGENMPIQGRIIPLEEQKNPYAFFLGRLDKSLERNQLFNFLTQHVYVTKLDMPRSRNRDLQNRGFCYVHCKTIEQAQKMLSMPTIEIFGRTCYIHKYDDRRSYNPDASQAGSFYSNYSSYQSSLVGSNRSSRAQSPERGENPEEALARQQAAANKLQSDGLPNPSVKPRPKPTPLVLGDEAKTFHIDSEATPTVAKVQGFEQHQQNIDPEATPTTNPLTHGKLTFDQFNQIHQQPMTNAGVNFINQAAAINVPQANIQSNTANPIINPLTNMPMTVEEAKAILSQSNLQPNYIYNPSIGVQPQMIMQNIPVQNVIQQPMLVQNQMASTQLSMPVQIPNTVPVSYQQQPVYNQNLAVSAGSNHSYHSVHSQNSGYDQNLVQMQNLSISGNNLSQAPVGNPNQPI